jgi:hypothetical protein
MEAQALPADVQSRLMEAIQKKMTEKYGKRPAGDC